MLPSLNVPVAMSFWVVPRAIRLFAGVIAIDWSTAGSTVNDTEFAVIEPVEAVMLVLPSPPLWARPTALIVATDGAEEVQVTRLVTFWAEPPVKVPVASNCCVVPSWIDALAGVTDRPSSAAGVTVSVVCPDTPPAEAVIVVMPTSLAVPILIPDGSLVTMPGVDEVQIAVVVRFRVLPSEYVPVAANCRVVCNGITALDGVIAIETKVGAGL